MVPFAGRHLEGAKKTRHLTAPVPFVLVSVALEARLLLRRPLGRVNRFERLIGDLLATFDGAPVGAFDQSLSDEGELLSARRAPRRGRAEDIFNRLVSIPSLLCHSHFGLELLLIHQDELRVYRQGKAFRRHGWVVAGRRLVSVEQRLRITSPDDTARLLPPSLPEAFDTAQLAEAAAIERRLAQQMTYCLRALGVLQTTSKRGNAIVHRRTDKVDPRRRLRCTGAS